MIRIIVARGREDGPWKFYARLEGDNTVLEPGESIEEVVTLVINDNKTMFNLIAEDHEECARRCRGIIGKDASFRVALEYVTKLLAGRGCEVEIIFSPTRIC